MLWFLFLSFVFVSVRDTVRAKKRGEPASLAQHFRLNFVKLKERVRRIFFGWKKLLLDLKKSYPGFT